MKRIFNHTKKTHDEWEDYDEVDFDWDESDGYEESEGYADDEGEYYEEESEVVYSDEAEEYYEEDGEYYVDESGEYYAEGDEAYYAEEEYYEDGGEEYYAEDGGEYYVDENGEYYAEDADVYYAEEEDVDYTEEKTVRTALLGKQRPKRRGDNVFLMLWNKFLEMAIMDRIITVTGVVVLIMALVTGSLYIGTKVGGDDESVLASVGSQLEGIDLIGEKGLLAIADAEKAKLTAAEIVEEEEELPEYDEEDYADVVTVKLNMTSVMKDLKLKFTNKNTGKLISNVPFSVTLTDPDGKSETWSDDDMDGIIYKKNIKAGKYSVLINELAGEKYENYIVSTVAQSVEVKKDIAYEKIDVSDEVKTEDEIDVSQEDTKINETEVESTLKDTVEWVESTQIAETYEEVSKTTIPDPATIAVVRNESAMSDTKVRLTGNVAGSASGNDIIPAPEPPAEYKPITLSFSQVITSMAIDGTATAKVVALGYTEGINLKYKVVSENEKVATVTQNGADFTIKGVGAGAVNISAYVYYEGQASHSGKCTMTVVVGAPTITLDKTEATVYVGTPLVLNATVANAYTDATIVAQSSDTKIATVEVKDKTVTVTGVEDGNVTITVTYAENGYEVKATCAVKVRTQAKDDKKTKLKNADGEQLYVVENEVYREAVYADYYTAKNFFVKGNVKYTGWQTIDGHVYYFTKDGVKVTGEQIIQGAKYNFASDGTLITGSGTMGIDVSKWNGKIDWKAVKNSGISYVIIRCGYRGSSQGALIEDPNFSTNIKGAIDAGLKVGVYFFTQATDEIEAVEEASYVLDKIKNYKISYPVFLDVEPSGGRGDKIDKATRTAVCKAFCETIQRAGYTAGIYANKTWLNEKMNSSQLNAYKIWLAQYAATPTYTGKYDMWQYTSKGKVSGISGDVDLNLSYLGY